MSRLLQAKEATRQGNKARVALDGPTGSGKTWTALDIACALVSDGGTKQSILVIDTERNSAGLYSHKFKFSSIDWRPPYSPLELAATILDGDDQYECIIVDSLTHFYKGEGGTLDIVDAAAARARGNSYAGWKVGTPAQETLVESILQADCHVIATMRSKMEYVLETDKNGKQVPKKVGMAPEQRAGIEYEFTVIADIDTEHNVIVTKSRCDLISDKMFKPHHACDMGATLKAWLDEAEEAPPPPAEGTISQLTSPLARIQSAFSQLDDLGKKRLKSWWLESKLVKGSGWPGSTFQALVDQDPERVGTVLTAIEVCATGVQPDPLGEEEAFEDEPVAKDPGVVAPATSSEGALNDAAEVGGSATPDPTTKPAIGAIRVTKDGKSNKVDDVLTETCRENAISPPERDRRIADYFKAVSGGKIKKLAQLDEKQKWEFIDYLTDPTFVKNSVAEQNAEQSLLEAFPGAEEVSAK